MGHFRKTAIATGLLALGMNSLFAAGTLNVFDASTSEGAAATQVQGGTVVGTVKYNSAINASIDKQSTLVLDIGGESTQLDVVSVNKGDSGVSYSATNSNLDTLTISVNGSVMLGSFNHNGKLYKFEPADNGDTLVVEMADIAESSLPAVSTGSSGGESLVGDSADVAVGGTDDGSVINVIVAYTQQFEADAGGAGNVAAYMDQMEAETNLSFSLSGVNTTVDVVDSYKTTYSESTNYRKDANFFQTDGFGEGQKLRTERDNNLADIMVVMTGNDGYDSCGYSAGFNVQGNEENPNGHNALTVIREGCGTGYYGFAHQLGFIFGADLNPGNSNMNGGGEAYAHGYCGSGWRSIMAYNCSGATGGKRLPLWSNPDNTYNGSAMGVAGVSNNVKVLNDRAKEVANFRFTPTPVDPPAKPILGSPAGETAPVKSPKFEWTTESPDRASSYILEITDANGDVHSFNLDPGQANCAAADDTACSYTLPADQELPEGTGTWKVTAHNTSGDAVSDQGTSTFIPIIVIPDPIIAVTPSGVVSDNTPTYTWEADNRATWYLLVVFEEGVQVFRQWYSAVDVNCEAGTGNCSTTPAPAIAIADGKEASWWVRGWNEAGAGDWGHNTFQVLPLP